MCKKIISFILLLLLGSFLCEGCESGSNKAIEGSGRVIQSIDESAYEITKTVSDISASYYNFLSRNEKVYIIANEAKRGDDGLLDRRISGIYMADSDAGNLTELTFPSDISDNMLDFDDAGNIYYMENDGNHRVLVRYSVEGGEIIRTDEGDSFDISNENVGDSFTVTADGEAVVGGNHEIYILDHELRLKDTVELTDGEYPQIILSNEGQILCVLNTDGKYIVECLDLSSRTMSKPHTLSISEPLGFLNGNGDYSMYYTDEYGVYGYDMKNESEVKLFEYAASDVTDSNIVPIGNGAFIGAYNEDGKNSVPVIYTKKETASDNSKTILTFAAVNMDSDIRDAIYEFNRSNPDIEIVIEDYSHDKDRMNIDIIAGKVPDLIDLSGLSAGRLVDNGLLEDLTPFFSKDTELDGDDILPSVLNAMKINDKIYYVSDGFEVISLAAKVSDVGENDGWDYSELEDLLKRKDDKAQFFYLNNKQMLLHMILWCQSTDFVDKENGRCYFDSDDFKNLLKMCNERGVDDEDYQWEEGEAALLRSGGVLFKYTSTDIDTFKETLAAFGEDVNFIGFPCSDKHGNYINFKTQIGISSRSEYKTEAWEFLKMLLSKEYQGAKQSFEYLPTRKDCFELRMEAEKTTEDYVNEMGREIYVKDYVSDLDGVDYEVRPFSEKEARQFIDMVESAVKVVDYDEKIMDIIEEEAAVYFVGDKELDETVNMIQSRVAVYINEVR
ncbi:MAG: extracellular solute-binding protein [Lachnospiraceae bacterium]|nr:extracellular solute-binding protein [Lachnospiraceae bacterium]